MEDTAPGNLHRLHSPSAHSPERIVQGLTHQCQNNCGDLQPSNGRCGWEDMSRFPGIPGIFAPSSTLPIAQCAEFALPAAGSAPGHSRLGLETLYIEGLGFRV